MGKACPANCAVPLHSFPLLMASLFLSLTELPREMRTPPGSSYLAIMSLMIQTYIGSQSVNITSLSMLIKAKRSICLHSDHTVWKYVSLSLAGM